MSIVRRIGFVQGLAVLALTAVAVLPGGVSAQDSATPTPGVLTTPASTIDCANAAPAPAAVFTIVSDKSEARYKAEEELAGKGANTAIGKTNAFIGTINFDANGTPFACSRFDVDLRTLQSDESRRDNFLYTNTLETQTYPLATFVLTEVQGLNGPLSAPMTRLHPDWQSHPARRDQARLLERDGQVGRHDHDRQRHHLLQYAGLRYHPSEGRPGYLAR